MTFQRVLASLRNDYPAESQRKLRQVMANMANWWANGLVKAMTAATPEQAAEITDAFDHWEENLQLAAEDPSFMPTLAPTHTFADFLSDITAGHSDYYCCRRQDCRIFCPSSNWVNNTSHYRCPACFNMYAPWKDGRDSSQVPWVKAQKILVLEDVPADADSGSFAAGTGPPSLLTGSTAGSGGGKAPVAARYFLAEWSDTVTTNMTDELKVIYSEIGTELENLPIEEVQARIVQLERTSSKSYFRTAELSAQVIEETATLNASSTKHAAKPWSFEHLRNGDKFTYQFAQYTYVEGVTKILSYQDQLRFWAYSKFLTSQALNARRAADGRRKR